jgi:uncharacterized protein (DUF3084 family)
LKSERIQQLEQDLEEQKEKALEELLLTRGQLDQTQQTLQTEIDRLLKDLSAKNEQVEEADRERKEASDKVVDLEKQVALLKQDF